MDLSDDLLSFSTKLVFGTDGLTNDLRVYWGKILDFFYVTKYSAQQIRQKEVQSAVKRFESQEEWVMDFESLNREDQILSIVFLRLLLRKAEFADQPIAVDNLLSKIGLLTETIGGEARKAGEQKYEECLSNFVRHENRKKIIVPASILPLTCDYLIKWVILIICRFNSIDRLGEFTTYESFLFIATFAYISYRDRKHNQRLFQKHRAVEDYKIDFQFTAKKYTWLAFFFITSLMILNFMDVKDEGGEVIDYLFGGAVLALYYFVALRLFPSGRVSEVSLLRQLRAQGNLTGALDSDKIDEAIIGIETEINSRTGRLDAYVLESALFGALAFGGFLQIISTDFISFKELNLFSNLIFNTVQDLVSMDIAALQKVLGELDTKNNLFCLAAIETLLCSGLFIAVIASRLRFSNIADRVRKALEIAKTYNTKVDLLKEKGNDSKGYGDSFTRFNTKVNEEIFLAEKALEEIGPISGYMEYFRNAGLLMFLLVLISCGLFVTSFLGWLYVAMGAVTWVYFNRKVLISRSKELTLILQLTFFRRSWVLFIVSLSFMLVGFLLRVALGFMNTNFLITVGLAGVGLYIFLMFILMPQYDDHFGEIDQSSVMYYGGRWNLIRIVFGFLILVSVTSLGSYAYLRYINASLLFGISTFLMLLLNFVVGYFCCKKKWLGILISIMTLFGGFITILSLEPPTSMGRRIAAYVVGTGTMLVCIVVIRIWRKYFHSLFSNFVRVVFILIFILGLPLIYGKLADRVTFSIPTTLTTLYQHRTLAFDSLSYWVNFRGPNGLTAKERPDFYEMNARSYRRHYGDVNGYTFIYDKYEDLLGMAADSLLQKGKTVKDSLTLRKALEYVQERKQIHRLFKYRELAKFWGLEANILLELKRKQDAINTLNEILKSDADEQIKKGIRERIKEISENKPTKAS